MQLLAEDSQYPRRRSLRQRDDSSRQVSTRPNGVAQAAIRAYLTGQVNTTPLCKPDLTMFDVLPALKREDSHGTVPLGWDIVVYDVTCS